MQVDLYMFCVSMEDKMAAMAAARMFSLQIVGVDDVQIFSSPSREFIHVISEHVCAIALYFDSALERATTCFFLDSRRLNYLLGRCNTH